MKQKNLILSYEGLAKPRIHRHFTSRIVLFSQQSTNKLSTANGASSKRRSARL